MGRSMTVWRQPVMTSHVLTSRGPSKSRTAAASGCITSPASTRVHPRIALVWCFRFIYPRFGELVENIVNVKLVCRCIFYRQGWIQADAIDANALVKKKTNTPKQNICMHRSDFTSGFGPDRGPLTEAIECGI